MSPKRKKTPFNRLLPLALLIFGTIAAAWGYDTLMSAQALELYPPPGSFVTVGSHRFHYLCQGAGEPTLILEHGYGGGAIDWLPLMDTLAASYRVCAFDRLGSDYSDPIPPEGWSFEEANASLHRALEELGISEGVLIGHSLGGAVAQHYAARYPVRGLVLMDGLSADVASSVVARMGSYRSLTPLARLGLLRPLAPLFVHSSYSGDLRRQMLTLRARASAIVSLAAEGTLAHAAFSSERLLENESHLHVPLLILVAGATDVPEGERFSASLESVAVRHPDSRLERIPGASHYLMVSHTDEVAAILRDWLLETGIAASTEKRDP